VSSFTLCYLYQYLGVRDHLYIGQLALFIDFPAAYRLLDILIFSLEPKTSLERILVDADLWFDGPPILQYKAVTANVIGN